MAEQVSAASSSLLLIVISHLHTEYKYNHIERELFVLVVHVPNLNPIEYMGKDKCSSYGLNIKSAGETIPNKIKKFKRQIITYLL